MKSNPCSNTIWLRRSKRPTDSPVCKLKTSRGHPCPSAMGTGERISLRSAVLFDFDKFDLKPEAREELERVAQKIQYYPSGRIVISGHTDIQTRVLSVKNLFKIVAQRILEVVAKLIKGSAVHNPD